MTLISEDMAGKLNSLSLATAMCTMCTVCPLPRQRQATLASIGKRPAVGTSPETRSAGARWQLKIGRYAILCYTEPGWETSSRACRQAPLQLQPRSASRGPLTNDSVERAVHCHDLARYSVLQHELTLLNRVAVEHNSVYSMISHNSTMC